MIHGIISQGIVFPLSMFHEIDRETRERFRLQFEGNEARVEAALMELDYSEMLGVKKFEETFEDSAPVYGQQPIFFP
jgi:hypothetical protein